MVSVVSCVALSAPNCVEVKPATVVVVSDASCVGLSAAICVLSKLAKASARETTELAPSIAPQFCELLSPLTAPVVSADSCARGPRAELRWSELADVLVLSELI